MKRIMHEAKPHLCLFASRDIQPGEEVTYDYGGSDCPWRTQTEEQPPAAKSSDPHLSRPVEMTPESPPVLVVQTEEQPPAAKSSDPHLSRPVEMTPESPPVLVVQAKDEGLTRIRAGSSPVVNITNSNEAETQCTVSSQLTESCEASGPSTECDLTITDTSIPKLRRTKSIEMRAPLDYDSDELFDSTSDDSGEKYIPKSGEDSSEDTDTSEMLIADEKINKLRFPSMIVHTGKESQSLAELDNTKNQKSERGRSRVRKQNRSHKRCSSKQVTEPIIENSASNSEQNLPCTDSSISKTNNSSLFIPAVFKKDDGSRMYSKKQYCLYCKKGIC
ncbi:uncharacterized protein LOC129457172 [Periophthalmus magnuspinnatus]|uniref:uncharacterized protein LOC129457172 n=1 Tax=Periophthalmus magnuspinnatus TaxID=409849 RepID=UPI002436A711|nr:uncharacterized protein LOC129457172 [Periophthalmus magnuspinnatus]